MHLHFAIVFILCHRK